LLRFARNDGSIGFGTDRHTNKRGNTMSQAKRIVLAARPVGEPKPSDFRLEEHAIPTPGAGEVLLRTIWLS
jgi:hypothetical protein